MITELTKQNETYFTVSVEPKKPLNLQELVEKILKKKNEPFAKIFVVTLPILFPAILKYLNSKNLKIKNIETDKKHFVMEF